MKRVSLLIGIFFMVTLKAQVIPDTVVVNNEPSPYDVKPSKESLAYNLYRNYLVEPPYGLSKVKATIKKIKANNESDERLSQKVWDAFTTKEKFTYCMIHAESYSQNCDEMPPIENEQKKIFSYIPDASSEMDLSDRQKAFIKKNKDSVLSWMKQLSITKKRIGLNFKEVFLMLNDKQVIPFLTNMYLQNRKDQDILTILLLLMKEANYGPFIKSQMHEKLYGKNADWMAFIKANKENQELIIKRATEFYNGK